MNFKQAERMMDAEMSGIREVMHKTMKMHAEGIDVIALSVGQPDFDTPEYIKEACKKALDEGHTSYANTQGVLKLRKAISERYKREGNCEYSEDEILVTVGGSQAAFAALMSYLNPGDEVLIPDPAYNIYPTIPKIAGAVVKTYDLLEENDYQVDVEQLKSQITDKTKMILLISPSNPVGSCLNEDSNKAIADAVRGKDIIVLADEMYDKLNYDGDAPASIVAQEGMKEQTLLINGFSKYYSMTGWRLGWIAGPANLLEPVIRMAFFTSACASTFIQDAAAVALNEEDETCKDMVAEFKERRDYIYKAINEIDKVSCRKPEGAFYAFVNIKETGLSSQEFCDMMMDEYHVALIPGNIFGKNGEGYVRLSYANSLDNIKEGVRRIGEAVSKL